MDIQKETAHDEEHELPEIGGAQASVPPTSPTPPDTQTVHPIKKSRPAHRPLAHSYGRIGKTTPDIKRSIHDIQMSEGHLEHDVSRLESDKAELAEQVSILEKQLAAAQKEGLSKSTTKRLEMLMGEARDRFQTLSKIVPEKSFSRDRVLMQEIIKKWHDYDKERTHQAAAEHKLNQNPEDKHAEGDINRSRAAAFSLHEEIANLVKKSDENIQSTEATPILQEGIAYTNEQAVLDKESREQTHPTSAVPPSPLAEPSQAKMAEIFSLDQKVEAPDTKQDEQTPTKEELPPINIVPPEATVTPAPSVDENEPATEITEAENPQAVKYANIQVSRHLDSLFGSKGFLGIGKKSGIDSPHWKEPLVGFSKKTVEELLQQKQIETSASSNKRFGTENPAAIKKIHEYLTFAINESGIKPAKKETADSYLHRAAALIIEHYMQTKGMLPPIGTHFAKAEKQIVVEEKEPVDTSSPVTAPSIPEEMDSSILPTIEPDLDPVLREDLHPIIEEAAQPQEKPAQEETPVAPAADPEIVSEMPQSTEAPKPISPFVPDANESLTYTHEQMLADDEKRSQKKIEADPPASITSVDNTVDPQERIEPEPISNFASKVESVTTDVSTPATELGQAQTMPQEIMPSDPQILASADMQVREHLNTFWGTKGFLGFGIKEGANSPHWNDALWGFGGKTVPEILEAEPTAPSSTQEKTIGIKNQEATKKMQDYLLLALSETGVHPEPGEKAEDYLYRAAAITINKFRNKEEK